MKVSLEKHESNPVRLRDIDTGVIFKATITVDGGRFALESHSVWIARDDGCVQLPEGDNIDELDAIVDDYVFLGRLVIEE